MANLNKIFTVTKEQMQALIAGKSVDGYFLSDDVMYLVEDDESDEETIDTVTLANASWAKIAEISESGKAQEYFAVGDEKTVELSTGEKITLVIIGFEHDDLSDGSGKAGITFGMKDLLSTHYRMSFASSSSNVGGWEQSQMRMYTMQTLFSQLPSDLQAVIKSVNKKATAGSASTKVVTSSDNLWLFSEVEIDGTTSAGYEDEGVQYEYWKTVKDGTVEANRIKYKDASAYAWWLRSPRVTNSTYWHNISLGGEITQCALYLDLGICFGFCV